MVAKEVAARALSVASREQDAEDDEGEDSPQDDSPREVGDNLPKGCGPAWVKRLTLSEPFTVTAALIISLNVIVMLFQADYPTLRIPHGCQAGSEGCTDVWLIVNVTFLTFYVFELTLRFFTFGCMGFFYHESDWAWNWFDFVIVAVGIIDLGAKVVDLTSGPSASGATASAQKGGGKIIVVVRVLRILRVLRVLRLFRQFKQLKLLARGLMESVNGVFWIMVMILMCLFLSAIFVTNIIGQNADLWPQEEQEAIRKYFGSVFKSMFTLFQFMTLDDWNSVDTMVTQVMPWLQAFFIPFIILTAMVILSLLTGVMADHMNAVREAEEKDEENKKGDDWQELIEHFHKVFVRADANGDQGLTRKEFLGIFTDKLMAAKFEVTEANLSVREANDIFGLMDTDRDGMLSWEEVKQCLEGLREPPNQKTLMTLGFRLRHLERQLARKEVPYLRALVAPTPAAMSKLGALDDRLRGLHDRIASFEQMLREVKDVVQQEAESED